MAASRFNCIDARLLQAGDTFFLRFKDERKNPLKKNLRFATAREAAGPSAHRPGRSRATGSKARRRSGSANGTTSISTTTRRRTITARCARRIGYSRFFVGKWRWESKNYESAETVPEAVVATTGRA